MKILIILIKWEGGVGRVVNSIIPLLKKAGHQVEVISREDDLKCYSTKQAFFKLRKEVSKKDYDILYTQDWSCALPFLFKRNHYCCFHGFNPSSFGKIIQKYLGKIIGRKLFVVGDLLHKSFPKSTILYNGVNTKNFYNLGKERKYLGYINVSNTATPETKEKVLELQEKSLMNISRANNIPPEKMNEWYNSLKCFVSLPRKNAGFNLCWLEAMAAGVPKIVGNGNGIGIKNVKKKFKEFTWENNVKKFLEAIK